MAVKTLVDNRIGRLGDQSAEANLSAEIGSETTHELIRDYGADADARSQRVSDQRNFSAP